MGGRPSSLGWAAITSRAPIRAYTMAQRFSLGCCRGVFDRSAPVQLLIHSTVDMRWSGEGGAWTLTLRRANGSGPLPYEDREMSQPTRAVRIWLAAVVLAASGAAQSAPTVSTLAGDTRVELSPTFISALDSLGVSPSISRPARLRGDTAVFPIPTGEIDLGTLKGEIAHNGGINLKAGDLVVNLSSFVIDTTGDAPVLTGIVKINDSIVGRLHLFDLALTSGPDVTKRKVFGSLRLQDVSVTLSAEAAAALNDVFGVTAFTQGILIGNARLSTYFYDPD